MSAELTERNKHWLEHEGKKVLIDGRPYRIKCSMWVAKYPLPHRVIDVSAEMVNKDDAYYREHRAKLGDDWSVDLIASEPEFVTPILEQLNVVSM